MILDERETLILAIIVLYLGSFLNKRIAFFKEYNIPEPVTGGILASLVFASIYVLADITISFTLETRDMLLIVFFTTIGLSSKLSTLLDGGKLLFILLALAVVYLFLQNFIGIGVAIATGLDSTVGVLSGSVSLSGGHGTTIAWAPIFKDTYNINNAIEIGIACATFGLVLGGIVGGPIAKYLINKNDLKPTFPKDDMIVGVKDSSHKKISVDNMLGVFLIISLAVGFGLGLDDLLKSYGIELPTFVTCLFGGIILTNTIPYIFKKLRWADGSTSLALVSDLSLNLFLAMSLMSLQLWTLIDLALPILFLLLAQVIFISLFVIFLVFPLLGKNYNAAVMSSGYAGLALGATPTAIANMTAVTKKFGPAQKAFLIVPLVGAFFIDISNAVIINIVLSWLS